MSLLYDQIGKTYTRTRAADPRISQRLIELLNLPAAASLVDIGAGTGNYSYALAAAGFDVTAVEPSATMRAQARSHERLHWLEGSAEKLPLQDAMFDGAVMTLCMHHFSDWQAGLREALRVAGSGPLVIFAFDVDFPVDFWLFDYFPDFVSADKNSTPNIPTLRAFAEQQLGVSFECSPFPLPKDLCDHFAASGWARPEIYFDEKYRGGISSFAKCAAAAVTDGLTRLREDLDKGVWHTKYGRLLARETYDRGYVFLKLQR